jgi:hypothetical protein
MSRRVFFKISRAQLKNESNFEKVIKEKINELILFWIGLKYRGFAGYATPIVLSFQPFEKKLDRNNLMSRCPPLTYSLLFHSLVELPCPSSS